MTGSARLILATRNPGKVREFERLLRPWPWKVVSLDDAGFHDDIAESGTTYADNAALKAAAVCRATGECALGDDSGIEVLALRGWPGPQSARWRGGDDANRLRGLLDEVNLHCPEDRRVRYVAVLAFARPESEPALARGHCDGVLVPPRGSAGFGYDAGFLSDDLGQTFGEADAAEKDRVSHRARAVHRLAQSGLLDWPSGMLTS